MSRVVDLRGLIYFAILKEIFFPIKERDHRKVVNGEHVKLFLIVSV